MSPIDPQSLFAENEALAAKLARSFPIPRLSVEEVAQEALLVLWQAACKFDPSKGAFEPFATIAIRNHLRNVFSKSKREAMRTESLSPSMLGDDDAQASHPAPIIDPTASPLLEAERADIREALHGELRSLSPSQRDALQQYAGGETLSEIARTRGVSKAAVRQMSMRAADQIRPNLESKGIDVHFLPERRDEHSRTVSPLIPPGCHHLERRKQRWLITRASASLWRSVVVLKRRIRDRFLGSAKKFHQNSPEHVSDVPMRW